MAKQARSENTRTHLVRSAAKLFDRNGFAGATLQDVSRSAGVTKGAFYFHFSSKDELGAAIQAKSCEMMRTAAERLSANSGTAVQALIDLTHVLAHWLENEAVIRASFRIARECGHRGPPFVDLYVEWLGAVEQLLRRARDAGELDGAVDIEVAATLVLTVCVGIDVLWWADVRRGSTRRSLAAMWQLILPGLAAAELVPRLRAAGSGGSQAAADG